MFHISCLKPYKTSDQFPRRAPPSRSEPPITELEEFEVDSILNSRLQNTPKVPNNNILYYGKDIHLQKPLGSTTPT